MRRASSRVSRLLTSRRCGPSFEVDVTEHLRVHVANTKRHNPVPSIDQGGAHCARAAGPALASGGGAEGELGGPGCSGAVPAAGAGDGCGGNAAGDAAAGAGGLAAGLCERRDEAGAPDRGFGLAAATAATPGGTGPDGSGFMMLTGGIDAALGNPMLSSLRGPGGFAWAATGPSAWPCGASVIAGSAALAQASR